MNFKPNNATETQFQRHRHHHAVQLANNNSNSTPVTHRYNRVHIPPHNEWWCEVKSKKYRIKINSKYKKKRWNRGEKYKLNCNAKQMFSQVEIVARNTARVNKNKKKIIEINNKYKYEHK